MIKSIFNWSGGKDSSLALHYILQEKKYDVCALLTSVSQQYQRVSMHGVREELLQSQITNIGLPYHRLSIPEMPTMEMYDDMMRSTCEHFKSQGIEYSIFGDIFLEDLKKYREDQLAKVQMQAVFPLWKKDTRQLLEEFIDLGFKAVIVCVNEKYLDQSFAGRKIDKSFVKDLPADVDPCGENGEYHSFVYDGPIMQRPVDFEIGEVVYRNYLKEKQAEDNDYYQCTAYDTGFWYCDLIGKQE